MRRRPQRSASSDPCGKFRWWLRWFRSPRRHGGSVVTGEVPEPRLVVDKATVIGFDVLRSREKKLCETDSSGTVTAPHCFISHVRHLHLYQGIHVGRQDTKMIEEDAAEIVQHDSPVRGTSAREEGMSAMAGSQCNPSTQHERARVWVFGHTLCPRYQKICTPRRSRDRMHK